MSLTKLFSKLEAQIQKSYEEGVTLEEAERLAAEFLFAQLQISTQLKEADLDARMRKSGLKAVRAAMYTKIVSGSDKKPTEAGIDAQITAEKVVQDEQDSLDAAEVTRDELERLYDIFGNAHVFYRGVAKGRFE